MDIDTIKPFINHNVEVLVAGVWIEGHLSPIVKGVIILQPLEEASAFYGPCALKAEVIQAIRQVRGGGQPEVPFTDPTVSHENSPVRSGLDQVTAKQRFGGR